MIFAQAATPAASPVGSFVFLGLMVVVFYMFIIRPQRSRARNQQQLAANLELGDRVQTIGGIRGVVRALDDDSVVIEVEQGKMRVARRAIASREPKS
jgi:preprotein translocase subunit YajC